MNRRPITPSMVLSAFLGVGLDRDFILAHMRASTLGEAQAKLVELKTEAKKSYKKLAFQYHPDRNNGAEDRMKKLNEDYDFVEKLNINPPPPPPPMFYPRVTIVMGGWGGGTVTNTSTYTSYSGMW